MHTDVIAQYFFLIIFPPYDDMSANNALNRAYRKKKHHSSIFYCDIVLLPGQVCAAGSPECEDSFHSSAGFSRLPPDFTHDPVFHLPQLISVEDHVHNQDDDKPNQ